MPSYTYRARDTSGKAVKGTMDASSKAELTDKLHKLGYMTTQVAEALPEIRIESALERLRKVHVEDMVAFNLQLANLIEAGISILPSLHTLREQVRNRKLRQAVEAVSIAIEAGQSFSEALSAHPQIFPKLFVSMVKAGEASGKLDIILTNYAAYCEKQAELRQKIKGAFFYPLLLLFASMGVVLFIVTFIIPQFAAIFMKVGIALPLPTLILYHVGVTLKQFWFSFVLFGILGFAGLQHYAGTATGRLLCDRLRLRLPLLGFIFRKAAVSRFSRTLGMLVTAGVPILQSLEIVKEVIDNEVLARAIENVHSAVEKGERISESLEITKEFPIDALQMISVGEETGNLDEMLGKIADFYDRSVEYSLKKLTTVLEPLLLVMMGTLVGFIMASMLLPMFDMIKTLKH